MSKVQRQRVLGSAVSGVLSKFSRRFLLGRSEPHPSAAALEMLESRQLLSNVLWTGTGDGMVVADDQGRSCDAIFATARQGDKVIAAGYASDDIVVTRLNADGTLDTTFAEGGRRIFDLGGRELVYGVAVDDTGRIILGGAREYSMLAMRLTPDGALDPTFNDTSNNGVSDGSGWSTITFPGVSVLGYAMALSSDGSIVVTGWATNGQIPVARFTAAGQADATFGSGGKVLETTGIGQSAEILSDGSVLVGGWATTTSSIDFRLVKYSATGSRVTNFGINGVVTTDFGNNSDDRIQALRVLSDGSILAGGFSGANYALAKYNPSGVLDTSWDSNHTGKVTADIYGNDVIRDLRILPDGKILAIGYSTLDFSAMRFNADGSVDGSFAAAGKFRASVGNLDQAYAGEVLADGRLILVGTVDYDTGFARLGANGVLDSGYGSGGKLVLPDTGLGYDSATGVAVQVDPIDPTKTNVVVASYVGFAQYEGSATQGFLLQRYRPDGTLDPAFGNQGAVLASFESAIYSYNVLSGAIFAQNYGVLVQSEDQKIVVAGQVGYNFVLARYNPNGTPDGSFGSAGIATFDLGGVDIVRGVVRDATGRYLVVGYSTAPATQGAPGGSNYKYAVARYTSNGSADASFGQSGKAIIDVAPGLTGFGNDLALQSDGKILLAGRTSNDMGVVRLNTNGTLDASFGNAGIVILDVQSSAIDVANSVLVAGGGAGGSERILLAGYSWTDATLVCLQTNGTLDPAFHGTGIARVTGNSGAFTDLQVLPDGRLIGTGTYNGNFMARRFSADGTLDSTFGSNGLLTRDFGSSSDESNASALLPSGDVVLAGRRDRDIAWTTIATSPIGPATTPEGATYTLSGTPGPGTTATVTWGDGTAPQQFTGTLPNHIYANGPASYTLQATYSGGGYTLSYSLPITVTNVAPIAAVTSDPANVYQEGMVLHFAADVTDPGIDDTFTYAWSVTKDGTAYPLPLDSMASDADLIFTPDDNGTYRVALAVTDKDGGLASTSTNDIQMASVVPEIAFAALAYDTITAGSEAVLHGTIHDVGIMDAVSVTIDWGDGAAAETSAVPDAGRRFEAHHVYAVPGTYEIHLSATDGESPESAPSSVQVSVTAMDPVSALTVSRISAGDLAERAPSPMAYNRVELAAALGGDLAPEDLRCTWTILSQPPGSEQTYIYTYSARPGAAEMLPYGAGHYVIRLDATDGVSTASGTIDVLVRPARPKVLVYPNYGNGDPLIVEVVWRASEYDTMPLPSVDWLEIERSSDGGNTWEMFHSQAGLQQLDARERRENWTDAPPVADMAYRARVSVQGYWSDWSGAWYPYSDVGSNSLRIRPYRVGARYGAEVPRSIIEQGRPEDYVIPVNDDYEEMFSIYGQGDDGQQPDYADQLGAWSDGAYYSLYQPRYSNADDDLAQLVLSIPPSLLAHVTLRLSSPDHVHLMARNPGWTPGVITAEQWTAGAAAFAGGDYSFARWFDGSPSVPINSRLWLEALVPDPDFTISLGLVDDSGVFTVVDTVHMALVSSSISCAEGSGAADVVDREEIEAMLAEPGAGSDATLHDYLVDNSFRLSLQGMSSGAGVTVELYSDEGFTEAGSDVVAGGGGLESLNWWLLYASDSDDHRMSETSRSQFEGLFGISPAWLGTSVVKWQFAYDEFTRSLDTMQSEVRSVSFVSELADEDLPSYWDPGMPWEHTEGIPDTSYAGPSVVSPDAVLPMAEASTAPSEPITADQIVVYYKAIYGKTGEFLLDSFQQTGNTLALHHYWRWWSDAKSDISGAILGSPGSAKTTIWIADDITPADAAVELYGRLLEASGRGYNGMRSYIMDHLSLTDSAQFDLWCDSRRQSMAEAASVAATIAQAYVDGIVLATGEGGNLVLTVKDISEGNYLSLLNVIPLVGSMIAQRGGSVLLKVGDQAATRIEKSLVQRIARTGCFLPGTTVSTETGTRAIETIRAGDRIWACDPVTGQWTLEKVTLPLARRYEGDLVSIDVSGETIEATGNHPFWVVRGTDLDARPTPADIPAAEMGVCAEGRWVDARDLRPGDVLRLRSGATAAIAAVGTRHGVAQVHNLWVDTVHTYAVGASSILVHNNSEECGRFVQLAVKGLRSPAGLSGTAFEEWALKFYRGATREAPAGVDVGNVASKVKEYGGSAVKEFDGFLGKKVWWECKTEWSSQSLGDFKSDLGTAYRVAESWGVESFEVISNVPVPQEIKDYCLKKGIVVREILH